MFNGFRTTQLFLKWSRSKHVKEGCAGVTHSDAAPRGPGRKGGPCRASATPPQRARPSCDPQPAMHDGFSEKAGQPGVPGRGRTGVLTDALQQQRLGVSVPVT